MNSSTPVFQVPVETQRNRATRRFALSRRRQRKGQALILAVLIMLMVAVLSAGFLVVVSGNLNQTARVTDKTRAVESARSGLKFVNDQLTYSQLGENWRAGFVPVNQNNLTPSERQRLAQGESRIPPANDPARSIYYSTVDQANGWAGTFAKFPDPLAPRSDAPQYLARVQRVVMPSANPMGADINLTEPTDPDSQDATKLGMLRITVIGLSNDDPAAFSKVVAYKQPSPFGRFMRTINNWDFKNNVVPRGAINQVDTTGTQLTLTDTEGVFPQTSAPNTLLEAPIVVMIGNAQQGARLRSAVVSKVSGNVLTLAAALPVADTPQVGERVELAAQVGTSLGIGTGASATQSQISYSNDSNFSNTNLTVSQPLNPSAPATSFAQSGSVFVNGSMALAGDLELRDLVPQDGLNSYFSSVRASGLVVRDATSATVNVSKRGRNGTQNTQQDVTGMTGANQLVLSSNTPSSNPSISASLLTGVSANAAEPLVSDGFSRIAAAGGTTRQTAPIAPPNFSTGSGATRYRQLASARDTNNPSNQLGIYINNPSDRERVYDATTDPMNPKLRDMTQGELIKMWLSRKADGVTDDRTFFYNRLGKVPVNAGDPITAAPTAVDASLEEQHLRGWVGPSEFHPRGATVELIPGTNGNPPTIAITLDPRSDNTPVVGNTPAVTINAAGPVTAKTWKGSAGGSQAGVYRKVFPWPANGVIFAEGNIRIRGEVTGAPSSLTVVSLNNIYIDGALSADTSTANTKKVLLLARKNVIANPTQAISQPDVQTTSTVAANVTLSTTAQTGVAVADISDFQPGDIVETATNGTPATVNTVSVVQSVTPGTIVTPGTTPGTLNVLALKPNAVANGDTVRTRQEVTVNGRSIIGGSPIANISAEPRYNAIQRRLQVSVGADGTNTDLPGFHLTFDHSAQKIKAFDVGTTGNRPTGPIYWDFKLAANPSGNVVEAEKLATGTYNGPGSPESFPSTAPSDSNDANTNPIFKLVNPASPPDGFTQAISGVTHTDINDPNISWHYQIGAQATTYNGVPFFYLASLNNRFPFGVTVPANPATKPRADISGNNKQDMLLATSIASRWKGSPAALVGSDATPDAAHAPYYFGFTPEYKSPAALAPSVAEDGLTSDGNFYQGDATQTTLDSRSLQSSTALGSSLVTVGMGSFSLYQPANLVGVYVPGALVTYPPTAPLPQYRFGHMKMERMDTSSNVTPGYTMNINAFVYAQTGSWFVIPNALFDKAQFASTTLGTSIFDSTGTIDLNRNGVADPGEVDARLRYARANYKINFTGAIAENQTALVNPAGTLAGAVQAWSNDWASYTEKAGAISTPSPGVTYNFDPSYADPANAIHNDPGFVMPQSDQLTYVE